MSCVLKKRTLKTPKLYAFLNRVLAFFRVLNTSRKLFGESSKSFSGKLQSSLHVKQDPQARCGWG